jgi:hypothetical protein
MQYASRRTGLLFSFRGPSDRFFERASRGSVGSYQAAAGPIAQLVQSARLISVRSVVQVHLGPPVPTTPPGCGAVAQLVERQLCKLDVVGSIPISSTRIQPGPRVPAGRRSSPSDEAL